MKRQQQQYYINNNNGFNQQYFRPENQQKQQLEKQTLGKQYLEQEGLKQQQLKQERLKQERLKQEGLKQQSLGEQQENKLFHRISENIETLSNLSNHMRDCNTITQEFVEQLKNITHDERLELIKQSNNPHMYQMSIWYQQYSKLKNMDGVTDNNLYFQYYLDLYITLYCVIVLRVWNDDELKNQEYNLKYYKNFIPQIKSTEQIDLVKFHPTKDLFNINHYHPMQKMTIEHKIVPVFAVKYNQKIYFKYNSELQGMLRNMVKWGQKDGNQSTGKLILFNGKEYDIVSNVLQTINYLIKKIITEDHVDLMERVKEVKKSEKFIYPIFLLENEFFKELKNKGGEDNVIDKLENLKI